MRSAADALWGTDVLTREWREISRDVLVVFHRRRARAPGVLKERGGERRLNCSLKKLSSPHIGTPL